MAFKVEVTPLPMFDPMSDPSSLSQRWKAWKNRFETYISAINAINVTDDKQKRALLLYQAGQETQELFDTFTDTGTDYATAVTKLDTYFQPQEKCGL